MGVVTALVNHDDLLIIDDEVRGPAHGPNAVDDQTRPWVVLVVDDEDSVHDGTRYALADFSFKNRPLMLVSAKSAAEARLRMTELAAERGEVAVILLDVVMETDLAGLDFARWVRDDLKDAAVRIILRTGQPGIAPERRVITEYDLNDYRTKTQLGDDQLFGTLTSALRAFEQIAMLDASRRAMEMIVETAADLRPEPTLDHFFDLMLARLGHLFRTPLAGLAEFDGLVVEQGAPGQDVAEWRIRAAMGRHGAAIGKTLGIGAADLTDAIADVAESGRNRLAGDTAILAFSTHDGRKVAVILPTKPRRAEIDSIGTEAFLGKLAAAYDSADLFERLSALNAELEERVHDRTKALELANTELSSALESQKRMNNVQRQFLAMVSHEFRTPLAIIDSSAQMMGMKAGVDGGMKGRLDRIQEAVRRLVGLIDNCIAGERLNEAEPLRRKPINPNSFLESVLTQRRMVLSRHDIRPSYDPVLGPIMADPAMLDLAVGNLVDNAAKYSPPGSVIEIGCRREQDDVVFSVCDRGVGIPEAEIPRIFERFFRASSAQGVPGTGIGLHLAGQIVELHGGGVAVQRRVGAGTCFMIKLPIALSGQAKSGHKGD